MRALETRRTLTVKKDTNKKSDKQDSDKRDENSEESETTEALRKILIRWGFCFQKKERISTAVWSVQN